MNGLECFSQMATVHVPSMYPCADIGTAPHGANSTVGKDLSRPLSAPVDTHCRDHSGITETTVRIFPAISKSIGDQISARLLFISLATYTLGE